MPSYTPLYGTYSMAVNRNPLERVVTRIIRRLGRRQRLMITLNGVVAGSTATSSRKRVVHSTTELGGRRSIETYNEINRATTAADVTAGTALLSKSSRTANPSNRAGSFKI